MRRRTSPVQQWVDSLPPPSNVGTIIRQQSVPVHSEPPPIPECTIEKGYSEKENYISHSNMTVSTPISVPCSPAITYPGRNVARYDFFLFYKFITDSSYPCACNKIFMYFYHLRH